MTNSKAVLAVLAGVAAGAALGMLFAPDKGSDTRKKISKKGEDLADALNEKIDDKFDELLDAITGKVKKTGSSNDAHAKTVEFQSQA
jgi:gas vesicle protein